MLKRDANKQVIDERVSAHLSALGAPGPSESEELALRALAIGTASAGQQKIAWRYILGLGGAGALMFNAQNERLTAFRLGSQAAAQALSTAGGGAWVVFRADARNDEDE